MAKHNTLKSAETPPKRDFPHVFTQEERSKGAQTTNQLRRERAKTEREKLEEVYNSVRDELMAVWVQEVKKGNMQALFGMHDRIFGTPAKSEPERTELEIVSGEPRGASLMDMLAELKEGPANGS